MGRLMGYRVKDASVRVAELDWYKHVASSVIAFDYRFHPYNFYGK